MSHPPRIRGRITRALALVSLSGALVAVTAPPASAEILKRLDYDSGSFGQWTSVQRAAPGRVAIVKSPVRQGRYASRFIVKPGDHPVPGGERAEVMWNSRENAGETSWWRWSTYFPTGFHPNLGGWNIFTQWHHTGPNCTSPIHFQVRHFQHRSQLELQVWGTPEQCREHIQRYVDNGVTTPALALMPFGVDARQAIRDLAPR